MTDEFDLDAYLQKQSQMDSGLTPTYNKADYPDQSLQVTTGRKVIDTQAAFAAKASNVANATNRKMGLDPNSFAGEAVNLYQSLHEGVNTFGATLGTMSPNIAAIIAQGSVPSDAINAYSRLQSGQPQPGDDALLAQTSMGQTYLSRMHMVDGIRGISKLAMDASKSKNVDTGNRDQFNRSIEFNTRADQQRILGARDEFNAGHVGAAAWDGAVGVAGAVVHGAQTIPDNKLATLEYMAENAPQIIAGVTQPELLAGFNAGYGLDTHRQGVTDYQEAHQGAQPDNVGRIKQAMWSAAAAGAETLANSNMVGALTLPGKGILGSAGKLTKGYLTEGSTEAFQTQAEAQAGLKDASLEDIVNSGVVGGAVGVGYHVAGHGGHGETHVDTATLAQQHDQEAAYNGAAMSGDTSALTDPASPTYNPVQAVQALHQRVLNPLTSEEDKAAIAKQADQVHTDLEARYEDVSNQVALFSPETLASTKEKLAANAAAMQTATPEQAQTLEASNTVLNNHLQLAEKYPAKQYAADQAQETTLQKQVEASRAALDQLHVDATPSSETIDSLVSQVNSPAVDPVAQQQHAQALHDHAQLQAQHEQLAGALGDSIAEKHAALEQAGPAEANVIHQQLAQQQDQLAQVQADHAALQAPVEQNSLVQNGQAAADKLLTLTMTNPDSVSHAQIDRLLSSPDSHLSDDQRQALRSFSDAQLAKTQLKNIDNVRTDVLNGGPGFKGVNTYQSVFSLALSQGNIEKATAEKDQLQSFAQSRTEKAQAIQDAYKQVKENGKTLQVIKTDSGWAPATSPLTDKQLKANGGIRVGRDTFKIVREIQLEAQILSHTAQAMASTLASKTQSQTQTQSATQVTDVSPTNETAALSPLDTLHTPTPVTDAPVTDGSLAVLRDNPKVNPDGVTAADYGQGHMLGKFFQQTKQTVNESTQRPLVAVRNFLSVLKSNINEATQFLHNNDTLEADQQKALHGFLKFSTDAMDAIRRNVTNKAKEGQFQWQDYSGAFMNSNGLLPQNFMSAVSYAMFSHVNDTAGDLSVSPKDVNALLFRDDDHAVTSQEMTMFGRLKSTDRQAAAQMGTRIIQALGLELAPGAPVNEMARLEQAVGHLAMNSLIDMGIVERVRVPRAVLDEIANRNKNTNDSEVGEGDPTAPAAIARDDRHFLRMVAHENENGRWVPSSAYATDIRASTKGSKGVLDKLFSVESKEVEPSLAPMDFTQTKAKRTQQGIPRTQAAELDKVAKTAHYLKQNMWAVMSALSTQGRYEAAGVDNESPVHAINVDTRKAKNDGLMSEVDNLDRFFGGTLANTEAGLDSPFYFMPSVWSNQRVGLAQNVINPQTSKVHRYMIKQADWDTRLDFNDGKAMQGFQLRVLESFGVKTEGNTPVNILADGRKGWLAYTEHEDIKAAVAALQATLGDTVEDTQANEASILKGVAKGGQGFHSLAALVALAEMETAKAKGDTGFTTDLPGEVDGVTNGPQYSLLFTGSSDEATLAQGGYFLNDSYKQFSDYKSVTGNHDMYEGLIAGILNRMAPSNAHLKLAIEGIVGSLTNDDGSISKPGRDIVKTPLTAVMFGSGLNRAVTSMGEKFIENIYAKLEDVAAGKGNLKDTLNHLNTLIGRKNLLLNTDMTLVDALSTKLHPAQVAAINASFNKAIGDAAKVTLKNKFGEFIDRRNMINTTATKTYGLYNLVENILRKQMLSDAARTKDGQPLYDLNSQQEAQLQKLLAGVKPQIDTALSLADKQPDSGLLMAKRKKSLSGELAHESQLIFGQHLPVMDTNGNQVLDEYGNKVTTHSTKVGGRANQLEEPGVGSFSRLIHSSDSAAQIPVGGLNVHDAKVAGVGNLASTAVDFNQSAFNVLLNYSPAFAMQQAYERSVVGFSKLMMDPHFAAAAAPYLQGVFTETNKKKESVSALPSDHLYQIRGLAKLADRQKLDQMAQFTSVGQYATEGGSYTITDADRAAITAKQSGLSDRDSKSAQRAAEYLNQFVDLHQAPVTKTALSSDHVTSLSPATSLNALDQLARLPKSSIADLQDAIKQTQQAMLERNIPLAEAMHTLDPVEKTSLIQAVQEQSGENLSVWGELGQPVVQSDASLVSFFVANPKTTAHALVDHLLSQPQDVFTAKLLAMIKRVTRSDIPVTYVTSQTGPEGAMGQGVDKSRGWYHQQGDTKQLFIKSPEFVESGLTTELVVHELLHAALGSTVQNQLDLKAADPSHNSDAYKLVAELEGLRVKAAELINSQGELSSQFANATSNIHELLSWGLSNEDFQQKVLNKIETTSQQKANGLVSGLQAFIRTLTGLLFYRAPQAMETGLGLLIHNANGLFKATSEEIKARDVETTHKYEDALDNVNNLSAQDVYDALGQFSRNKTSASHDTQLRGLLNTVVSKLYDPRNPLDTQQALTSTDVYLKAIATDTLPFASRLLNAGFVMNLQEGYVLEHVEAVVKYAMEASETLFARTALEKLYREARSTLNYSDFHKGDWDTAHPHEQALAQEKYNFLFKLEAGQGGKSEYLSRFAALGLASQEVSQLLKFGTSTSKQNVRELPWNKKLIAIFQNIVNRLAQLNTKVVPGQLASTQLSMLVGQLTDIQAKRKARLMDGQLSILDKFENTVRDGLEKIREGRNAAGQSTFFRTATSPLIKFVGVASSTIAGRRVGDVMDKITRMRDDLQQGRQGMTMGLINEVRGITDDKLVAGDLLSNAKKIEATRKQAIEYTAAAINDAFESGHTMPQNERDALTKVGLRTNTQALLATHDVGQIYELLKDPVKMAALQTSLEQQLLKLNHGDYYIRAVKQLAYHKIVGGSVSANQMQNSHSIARLYGTHVAGQIHESDALHVESLLEPLMSVYAHGLVNAGDHTTFMAIMAREAARSQNQNGVEMMLKLHQSLLQQSKEQLFVNKEALMQSGYVPEIHDNKIEMLVTNNQADLAYLSRAGFAEATAAQHDSAVYGGEGAKVMLRRGAGQASVLTGGVAYTGMHAKGSSATRQVASLLDNMGTNTDPKDVEHIHQQRAAEIKAMFAPGSLKYDPSLAKTGRVSPLLNGDGKVVDYRYTMLEAHRDALLDRDNSMEQVLGVLAGSIVDKVHSPQQNIEVVRAMYDQYRSDYSNRPSSYLKVGPDSTDTRIREQYRLLSDATKEEIKRVWHGDNMYIPADQLDLVMGYRKYSLTEPFQGVRGSRSEVLNNLLAGDYNDDRNVSEKILIGVANAIWGEKAAWRVGQAEDGIQAIMKGVKDILVIKNIKTMIGNIKSNTSLLMAQGLSLREAVMYHAIGLKGAMDYRRDNKRLQQLTQAVQAGYVPAGLAGIQQEILELQDRIARNPVKVLVDAGLMPSIVEDVAANDSRYSYSSRLAAKLDAKTQWVPQLAKDAAKQVAWFSHDSVAYKFLSQTTQLSDFVARYALYQHLTTRTQDTVSSSAALQIAENSFINYDIPSHRNIQYMNDMGLLMFTKYTVRIQKTIARLFKEKPARVMAMIAYGHYVEGASVLTDSSWLHKVGHNPLTGSVLSAPGALEELPAVHALMNW